MLPRQGYLTSCIEDVKKHFEAYTSSFGKGTADYENIWFEYNDVPLRWHLPVGVLFDMAHLHNETDIELPWKVIVHFQTFPSEKIVRFASEMMLNLIISIP